MRKPTKQTKAAQGRRLKRVVRQIERLEIQLAGWEYAASLLRTGMGLKDGTDLRECLIKYEAMQTDTLLLKVAESNLRHGVIQYIKDSENSDKPEPVDRLKFLLDETQWW